MMIAKRWTVWALAVGFLIAGAGDAAAQGRGRGAGRFPGFPRGRGPDNNILPERDKREIIIEPGRVTSEILCEADVTWSYRLYAPRNFTPDRRWPVLFVIAPGGGTAQSVRRYADGAEFNGFLVAISTQAGKSGKDDLKAFDAMVRDVRDRVPSDPQRFFFSGFADGARLVLNAAAAPRDFAVAGVLACGDGDAAALRPSPIPVYALCGTNSPRRNNVVQMFDPPGNPQWRLELFAGGHEWGNPEDLSLALTWLNAANLRAAPPDRQDLLAEKARLEKSIADLVRQRRAPDIERAHDWAECLTLLTTPPDSLPGVLIPHALALELRNDARVKLYREARSEMLVFAMRFFGGDTVGGTPTAEVMLKARELAFRYRDSRLRVFFERLGQPVLAEQ